jgi:hypothetical protein
MVMVQSEYIVEVGCEPVPHGYEGQIANSLARYVNVHECVCTPSGVVVALSSDTPDSIRVAELKFE